MRRGWAIALAIVTILVVVGVGVGAYNAGVDAGVRQAADASHVIQVVGGYGGRGFFPFGSFLFPLFLFGFIALISGAFRRGRWSGHDHHGHGPGGWKTERGRGFEERAREWHTRQHEQGATAPDPGGGAATA